MPPTKGQKRREQVLTTAKQLFATKGYSNVTMGDIASACNVARTTLYDYFSTREDIVLALLDEVVTSARSAKAVGDNTYEKLCSLALDSLTKVKDNRLLYRIVFQEAGTFSQHALQRMAGMTHGWGEHVRRVISEGQEEIKSNLSIDDVVFAYQALVSSWGRKMTLVDSDFDVLSKSRELVSVLWYGVGKRDEE